jgi:glucose/arabinose dehydrogenase
VHEGSSRVAVAKDGALLISEDGNDTIWRVVPAD